MAVNYLIIFTVVSGKPTAEEAVSEEPVKKAEIEVLFENIFKHIMLTLFILNNWKVTNAPSTFKSYMISYLKDEQIILVVLYLSFICCLNFHFKP